MVFVGYNPLSIGYRLYDPEEKEVVVSKDVAFDEIFPAEGASEPRPSSIVLDLPVLGDSNPTPSTTRPDSPPPDAEEFHVEDFDPLEPDADDAPEDTHTSDGEQMVKVPKWYLDTIRGSGVTEFPPDWQQEGTVRRSCQLHTSAELLQVNYALMSSIMKDKEPVTVH